MPRNNEVAKQRYCRRSPPRVLGQQTQLLGKRYTSSKQWSNVWPSLLEVHPIPHPTVGEGPGLHQSVGFVVPRDTFNATALNASKLSFVTRQVGPFNHLRNIRETRHCRVQGPEPDRPPNTEAHLPFSQNRCCGRRQRWFVCQWDRERDTGSVFSGYRSKHHHHSDPVVEGHVLQSSINTKQTRTCQTTWPAIRNVKKMVV